MSITRYRSLRQYTSPCCSVVLNRHLQSLTRLTSRSQNRKRDNQDAHSEESRLTETDEVEEDVCLILATGEATQTGEVTPTVPTRSPHISILALLLTNNPWATLPPDGCLHLQARGDFLVDHLHPLKVTEAHHHPEGHLKIITKVDNSITVAAGHTINRQALTDSTANLVPPASSSTEVNAEEVITTTNRVVGVVAAPGAVIVVSRVVKAPPGAETVTGDIRSTHLDLHMLVSFSLFFFSLSLENPLFSCLKKC